MGRQRVIPARAREAEGDERERLWAEAVASFPGYARYSSGRAAGSPSSSSSRPPGLMPAPLGKTPTKKMPNIQVFGMDDSSATRNTLRFFRERRIVVHYVDLRKKPIARGELQRFVERLGAAALLDDTSKAVSRAGPRLPVDGRVRERPRLLADARLLRLPLVRYGELVTAGKNEETWKAWLAKPR